jgi:hypothetical protein
MIAMKKLLSTLLLCAALQGRPALAGPAEDGDWTEPFSLPLIAIHAAMLPTGKVLLFSAEHGVPGIHGWLLDPISLALQNVPPPAPWNPDCAGHSFLADGRLLVAGGTLGFNPTRGPKTAAIFDSFTEQWVPIENMRAGRWYPSNVTLPDGRVITISGLNDTTGAINSDVELWNPQGTSNWELLGQKTVPFYPYLHVLSSGLVFRSGPNAATETYNPHVNVWTAVANRVVTGRYEAPALLLPPNADRVMVIGGNNNAGGQPVNSAEVIDLSAATPQWTALPPMNFRRMDFNAAILPDGKVFVVGGRSDFDSTPTPVLTPEIFDPQTSTWDMVDAHQKPRRYHSTAILLPDARVLVAGGDFQPSGEIYSPPYLFQGSRPVIRSAPAVIRYGESFPLDFISATAGNRVALIRYSSVTHSVNFDQRYVRLADLSGGSGFYTVNAPATSSLAPPGYYMLFVVDQNGVPSVSARVQVLSTDPAADTFTRTSLGANWTRFAANAEIVNGADAGAPAPSATIPFLIGWTGSTFGADQFSEAIIAAGKPDTMLTEVFVRRRMSDAARYALVFTDENADGTGIANPRWELRYDGVAAAQVRILASAPAMAAPQPGDTLRVEARGTSSVGLKGFHNGVEVVAAVDSAAQRITAGGPVGMAARLRRGGYTAPANAPLFASWRGGTAPTLAAWLAGYGLPGNAPLASDTDGDGFPLLTEYLLALDPSRPSASPLTASLQGGELWFEYPMNVDATDVQMTVEHSTDLITWISTGVTFEPLGATGTVRRMRARIAVTGEAQRFARIRVR